jgi:hypothetical protein
MTVTSRSTLIASAPIAVQIDPAAADALLGWFGAFKPVGHVMVGMPAQAQVDTLAQALDRAGWPDLGVRQFSPPDRVAELQSMVEHAGVLAGFGYEITLLRRYLRLAQEGHQFLLVQADDVERAAEVAELARLCGATVAVHYRRFAAEELIP